MTLTPLLEDLAEDFLERPIEFGTEADLRVRLHQLLSEAAAADGRTEAVLEDPRLVGDVPSYKRASKDAIEGKLRERGAIDRVRLEVTVDTRRTYDVVRFADRIGSPIEWVRNGSKRFDETDLEAAVTLKFIKNKCYPPLDCPITDDRILEMDLEALQSAFDARENSIAGDLADLAALPDDVAAAFVLVSNNNYLFAEPLGDAEAVQEKKRRAGEAVRAYLREAAADVGVLYVHPRGWTWLADA